MASFTIDGFLAMCARILFCVGLLSITLATDELLADGIQNDGLLSSISDEELLLACRKDPTWKTVDYQECQRLTGWTPRGVVWQQDAQKNLAPLLEGKESNVTQCLHRAFENAKETHAWARCETNSTEKACLVRPTKIRGHYYRGENEVESDELVVLSDAFTEQEAFGVEALGQCLREIFVDNKNFYEAREFGNYSASTHGMYNADGGNFCSFLNGLLQIYLPGVAATTFSVIRQVHRESGWSEKRGLVSPDALGIHSAEFLQYRTNGKLSLHADDDTLYTISVALSNFDSYEGGYFRLATGEALFKVPRRSAIVFFGESLHGVTEIQSGERKVFVTELWDEDDASVGFARPSLDTMDDHRLSRGIGSGESDASSPTCIETSLGDSLEA